MKILVHPHLMEMGGSQFNAIELADAIRGLGHEVVLYAPPGVLIGEVRRRGLEVVLAPARRRVTPSPASALQLLGLVRRRGFDLVHAYEWTATLDAVYGPGCLLGTPVVSTVMSMVVPDYLPSFVPLVVGTRELHDAESRRRRDVLLMEPPVDTERNRPGAAPYVLDAGRPVTVRERWSIPTDERLVVQVGRLSDGLKLGGVLEAIRAMLLLPHELRVHLLIVGDGPQRAVVESAAEQVNRRAGRRLVTLTGLMMDPRPAYDAADLVIGMGGSMLRGLAFGKPAIVQGERGFWQAVDAESLPRFRYQGWFGIGDGSDGAPLLAGLIARALAEPARMTANGALGRDLVVREYSLANTARQLVELYSRVAVTPVPLRDRVGGVAVTSRRLVRIRLGQSARRAESWIGRRFPGRFPTHSPRAGGVGPSWS